MKKMTRDIASRGDNLWEVADVGGSTPRYGGRDYFLHFGGSCGSRAVCDDFLLTQKAKAASRRPQIA